MAGRKSKLTEELTKTICENLELGLSYNLSCKAAWISFQTFNEWMKAGEEGTERKYIDFYNKVQASEVICAKNALQRIREAAEAGTWSAAAWLLERRYREDFGRNERLDVKAETKNENFNVNYNVKSPEEIEQSLFDKLNKIRSRRENENTLFDKLDEIHS